MDRWRGKIAVVTGASAGIGASIVKDLAKAGLIVIGLARRADKIEEFKNELKDVSGEIHSHQCDITNEESIKTTFNWIIEKFGGINILINNAGIFRYTSLLDENNGQSITDTVNTNLLGLLFCTREAFKSMNKSSEDAHIINISSDLGHQVSSSVFGEAPIFNVYPGTKFAVRASSEVIRQELNFLKKENIKISCLSPGLCETEMAETSGLPNSEGIYKNLPHLKPEDVSNGVLYMLGTPRHVLVYDLILKPVGQVN